MDKSSGERFEKAMAEKGWSQKGLSRETGISEATIKRMRDGGYKGYVDTWVRVCNVMGVGLTDVLQGGQIDDRSE